MLQAGNNPCLKLSLSSFCSSKIILLNIGFRVETYVFENLKNIGAYLASMVSDRISVVTRYFTLGNVSLFSGSFQGFCLVFEFQTFNFDMPGIHLFGFPPTWVIISFFTL